mmetsp:Transcript_13898/g.40064  ORF Transcript_13898/g.40064 Transcript_13898/m.40064 type:complete len:170 (+) Transcript_13898:73-582(+)|eukprot:CAMPEP_0176268780 /NCGR_PEP_ID=MMETSP0121_2-20121125/43852_1 /TAXON_ID=160619 /ORGANISM="Kryptoperidinium foliaceum, Strain CCMP 1326" /LENGTH=169 /DNA_ID=CAMNT_0017608887 /DNA_START=63 /DNA_END=572 /DNA_ORIENTATION=-
MEASVSDCAGTPACRDYFRSNETFVEGELCDPRPLEDDDDSDEGEPFEQPPASSRRFNRSDFRSNETFVEGELQDPRPWEDSGDEAEEAHGECAHAGEILDAAVPGEDARQPDRSTAPDPAGAADPAAAPPTSVAVVGVVRKSLRPLADLGRHCTAALGAPWRVSMAKE